MLVKAMEEKNTRIKDQEEAKETACYTQRVLFFWKCKKCKRSVDKKLQYQGKIFF